MKKILSIIIIIFLQNSTSAQDFVLNNPVMTPNPGVYPGGLETVTFDFYVSGSSYTFSSNPQSNNYATITFSFTKLNPTFNPPTGTGAVLFNWVLTNNGGSGVNRVYTWTGTTKDVTMLQTPPAAKYKISFVGVPITFEATREESDVRVAGQFTDPGNAPTGLTGNNNAVISTYTTAGAPLPVRLLLFKGDKQGNASQLNWETSSELNSSHFEIQHSNDGNNWQSVGKVVASKNSNSARNYDFRHINPVNGNNFYRLRLVDSDGKISYSNTVMIKFVMAGIHIAGVYPNPFVDRVSISYYSQSGAKATIQLFNTSGKIVLSQVTNIQEGTGLIEVDGLEKLAKGSYLLKATIGNTVLTEKILK